MKSFPKSLILFLGFVPLFLAPVCNKEKLHTPKPGMEWLKTAVIYEVNLRQFSPQGNIGGFMAHIPRLKNLGVDVLWLMPVNPIGAQNRKGSLGSYYSVRDYTAVNPEFGTLEQFKMMVQMAHSLGMKVIIDWVANHTAWDHPWITEHPDKLNFKNKAMRKAMTEAMKFWVRECDIDGFRCDVAFLVPTDYWEEARTALEQIKPMFMLAEADWHPDVHSDPAAYTQKAFDANYHWDFMHTSAAIHSGKKPLHELKQMLKRDQQRFPAKTMRMTFLTNHDENSWNGTVNEKYGERWEPWSVLTYTLPGSVPLIYSGQEANLNHRLRFFDKDTISWADTGWNYWFRTMNTSRVFAFKRSLDNDEIWVFLNFGDQPASFRLDGEQLPEHPEFLFNYPLQGTPKSGYILPPYGFVIMTRGAAPAKPTRPSLPSNPDKP
jgi:glycosidase